METPSDYIALGVVLMFVAGILVGLILAGDDENAGEWAIIVGGVVGGVAQILLLIGIIAKGVEVGNRTSAERTTASGA